MEREALKLVFDALKQCNTYAFAGGLGLRATAHRDALAILEKALAQPEQEPMCPECKAGVLYECVACSSNNYPPQGAQKPVAWMYQSGDKFGWRDEIQFVQPPNYPVFRNVVALFTAPPQRPWVGLTAEQAAECWTTSATQTWKNFEAKLKEKNT